MNNKIGENRQAYRETEKQIDIYKDREQKRNRERE